MRITLLALGIAAAIAGCALVLHSRAQTKSFTPDEIAAVNESADYRDQAKMEFTNAASFGSLNTSVKSNLLSIAHNDLNLADMAENRFLTLHQHQLDVATLPRLAGFFLALASPVLFILAFIPRTPSPLKGQQSRGKIFLPVK